jgi:uncharacterized oxidoreductase
MFSLLLRPDILGVETGREEAVTHFLAWVKGAAPNAPGEEILLPGEIERRTREQRQALGIPLDAATLAELVALGERLDVPAAGLAA